MSTIAGLALSRSSGALNQLQQRLGDNLLTESLQGITKHLEGQFPQMVNDAFPDRDNNGATPNAPYPQPANGMSAPMIGANPTYPNYYGYGRPFPANKTWPVVNPLAVPVAMPAMTGTPMPQPLGYAAPIGYIGRVPIQTGPAPSRWYS